MFYDRYLELCKAKGVKPTNACLEAGLSRGLAAKWKSTQTEKPSADALEKLAAYFKMSIDEVLGKEKVPTQTGEHLESNSAFFRLKKGLEPYDISEADADFLLDVYKAHIKKNQQE